MKQIPKDPAETITVTFDFSDLAASLSSATVTAAAYLGPNDAAPSAILSGSPSIADAMVMHRITGGQRGTTYVLRCEANDTDGEVHVVAAALVVKKAESA